jgi:very-short-patch-repair endonuclease
MKNNFPRLVISSEIRRKMLEIAREFRKEPTKGEAILWQALRGKKLDGVKFRRQQPIGYFVVDFYNSAYRLVIEVDGPIHNNQVEADRARQDILEVLGLNILRINTEMAESNLTGVISNIRQRIEELKIKINEFPTTFMGVGLGARVRNDDKKTLENL